MNNVNWLDTGADTLLGVGRGIQTMNGKAEAIDAAYSRRAGWAIDLGFALVSAALSIAYDVRRYVDHATKEG